MYRKFSASHIFNGHSFLPDGFVLITHENGAIDTLVKTEDAGADIQYLDGILSPGFINAHCHLELSHMKGHIPEKTGLVDFVLKVILERHFTDEEILTAIEKADREMYESGIAAVGDICNNTLTIEQKQRSPVRYHNFIEASGFPPAIATARLNRSIGFYNDYAALFASSSLVPHAPYSVSPNLFRMINEFSSNGILTIHNQEAESEDELFKKGTGDFTRLYQTLNIDISFFKPSGRSSLQTFLPLLNNFQSLILVHNVHTKKADLDFEKDHTSTTGNPSSVYYCLCPNANHYISGTLPDVNLLVAEKCNMVLGTDSLASNHQLSILEEMKTLQHYFPDIKTETLLQWATINGAKALQMDDQLGSFEKGKTPGLVLIEGMEQLSFSKNSKSKRVL